MRELDELLKAGALTREEVFEYVAVLDEYDGLRVAARRVGANAVASLEAHGKIDYYLERSFDAQLRFGNRGIFDLVQTFFALAEAAKPGQPFAIRHTFVRGMQQSFVGHLSLALERRLTLGSFSSAHREAMHARFEHLATLPGNEVMPFYDNWTRFARLERMLGRLEAALPRVALPDPVRDERRRAFRDLVSTRRIPHVRFAVGDATAEFQEFSRGAPRRTGSLMLEVPIVLYDSTTPPAWLEWSSAVIIPDGVGLLHLDCSDGTLIVQDTGVTATELCAPGVARALEDAVLTRLWEAIRGAEDDLVLVGSPPPRVVTETREALAGVTILPDAFAPASAEISDVRGPVLQAETVLPQPVSARGVPVPRGLRANEVLRRFTRLFGSPERVVGSHYVYRGRDGQTYPIALHMGREVGTGMLLKSLRNLGVTVEDFEAAAR